MTHSCVIAIAIAIVIAISSSGCFAETDTGGAKENTDDLTGAAGGVLSIIQGAGGGTEFMFEGLLSRLPEVYRSYFSFAMSVSPPRALDNTNTDKRKNVVWLRSLHTGPEAANAVEAFQRGDFALVVFVSEWQKTMYEQRFGIDFGSRAVVLRDAIVPFDQATTNNQYRTEKEGPLRMIYHATPQGGLSVLLQAFVHLYDKKHGDKIHLDVYPSSYGSEERDDEPFRPLFETCRNHPGCTYHGYKPNAEIRGALRRSHLFAHPNTRPEPSCLAVIEAMSAGVDVLTSSHPAMLETIGKRDLLYPHDADADKHEKLFLEALDLAITNHWTTKSAGRRRRLALEASQRYDWGFPGWNEGRIGEWIHALSPLMPEFASHQLSGDWFRSGEAYAEALFVSGKQKQLAGDRIAARAQYEAALRHDPKSSLNALSLGVLEVNSPHQQNRTTHGIELLLSTISDAAAFEPSVPSDSIAGWGIIQRAAYWYMQIDHPDKTLSAVDQARASNYPHDDCISDVLRATYTHHIPLTKEEASKTVAEWHRNMDDLLPRAGDLVCDNTVFFRTIFPLAYYDLGFRDEMSKWANLLVKLFSESHDRTAPGLVNDAAPPKQQRRQAITQKNPLRIGFVSSFFVGSSSIWGSFGKTITSLQKNPLFEVEMIYYPRDPITAESANLSLHPRTNLYLKKFGLGVYDQNLHRARQDIVNRKYDVLVYLDMWMSGSDLHRLGVAKLAPIQAYTHGHPVTSGINSNVMDYFISWAAAEQPDPEIARSYYTENLVLLPDHAAWEYYEPRTKDGYSLRSEKRFDHYTLDMLASEVLPPHDIAGASKIKDPSSNVYFCAQASFKFHFAFDSIIAKIQEKDPNAIIVLIELTEIELENLQTRIKKRFEMTPGVDLDRIVFVPKMNHHHLMAMYSLSDVVLDSVYFGGDTTSREAFEAGSPIITLPHKTIGQRWTYAYYSLMGIHDFVAKNHDDYVDIATNHATSSSSHKAETRERIQKRATETLFRREEGPRGWADMFLDIATRPRTWRWKDEIVLNIFEGPSLCCFDIACSNSLNACST